MALTAPSFFQSLAPEAIERLLEPLARRRFPAGGVLLSEGDRPTQMYVVASGVCEVLVRDSLGVERRVGQMGPGASIGETALFAGQVEDVHVAPASVRALTDVEVVVLDAPGFYALAAAFPQVLHNIGAILSQRLSRSYQQALRAERGRLTVLQDYGAPPDLGYTLACSVAWHSRQPTLLLVVRGDGTSGPSGPGDTQPSEDGGQAASPGARRARRLEVDPIGEFAPAALAGTVDELVQTYAHVLVQVPAGLRAGLDARVVRLAAPHTSLPADASGRAGHTLRAWVDGAERVRPDPAGVLDIPPLADADECALRDGLLPAASAAGKALGWAARDLCGLKVGLALGAGSVKGYAHYGVLRAFERAGLAADYVAGTSIGAIIAATYALGHSADEAARTMEETSVRAFRLNVPVHALLSNAGVHANFRQVSGDRRIEDLDLPLALVAADIETGREVVFRRGLLRTAALASMAIPGIYPPLRMGPYVLVDGGIVNPVPISVVRDMGADVVIAVNLGRPAAQRAAGAAEVEAGESAGRLPSLVQTITRSVEVMQGRIAAQSTAAATVLIEPRFSAVAGVGLQSFHQGRPYIAPGEAAAEAALPRIAAALPWIGAEDWDEGRRGKD